MAVIRDYDTWRSGNFTACASQGEDGGISVDLSFVMGEPGLADVFEGLTKMNLLALGNLCLELVAINPDELIFSSKGGPNEKRRREIVNASWNGGDC